jgi:hypothetical protein
MESSDIADSSRGARPDGSHFEMVVLVMAVPFIGLQDILVSGRGSVPGVPSSQVFRL